MNILALNAGSSSLKFRLFQVTDGTEEVLSEGTAERVSGDTLLPAAQKAIDQCKPLGINAVGHRLVHGGAKFTGPTRITSETLTELKGLRELDPLHNPAEIALIEATQRLLPNLPTIAVFDTAFHRTLPEVAYTYALPREISEKHVLRRYGFHGLSHQYVSGKLLECLGRPADGTRLITCHLGSGASACALLNGKSVDTSMGMTPLEGLVMGTRSGDVDPGLLLYLLREQKMSAEDLDDMLNHQSGLQGVSGLSSDVRDLEKAASEGSAQAELALALFAYRVRKYIGAYAAALGGLDAVAFTGGVGEHSASMRARICTGLDFFGVRLNADANQNADGKAAARLSPEDSPVEAWVIPTDEERQIAREVTGLLQA
ncbi:MAG: acetate/propionate family kinase [Janthinobacterium lividum]